MTLPCNRSFFLFLKDDTFYTPFRRRSAGKSRIVNSVAAQDCDTRQSVRKTMTHNGLLRIIKKRSCYLIAYLYEEGLAKGNWTTQAGASNALGVSQAELSLALRTYP